MQIKEAKEQYNKEHGAEGLPLRAVLFDMDGVLFDSMPLHAECWAEVGEEFGLHIQPLDVFLHEGRNAKSTINVFSQEHWGRDATDEEIRHIYSIKSAAFQLLPDAPPMKGAARVLDKIKADNIGIQCVTGSNEPALLNRLYSTYPNRFTPHLVVSGKDYSNSKPHPDPYLIGLERGQLKAEEAIVVENAPLGVEAAVAAGIFTIGVNTGPLDDQVLWDAGASLVYPSMDALADDWNAIYTAFEKH